MRWLTQFIILIILITGLYIWFSPLIRDLWLQSKLSEIDPQQARASSFFPLKKGQWLNFDIANQSRLFRFYFHAGILDGNTSPTLSYQINYQWLDSNGEILAEQDYHINTRPSPFLPELLDSSPNAINSGANSNLNEDSIKPKPLATRFYNHDRSAPSVDQALYLSPIEQPLASKLRVRIKTQDANIDQVGLRPYIQHQRDPKNIEVAWQRMSRTQREAVTSGSIYPSFLISDYERLNLLSAYWRPIGPVGVLDKDYQIETLYIRENTAPALPFQTIVPDGLFASPNHWLTFKLPAASGKYQVRWKSINRKNSLIPKTMSTEL